MNNCFNREEIRFFFSLVRAGLLSEKLPKKPAEINWEKIFHLAQSTSLLGICLYGLLGSDEDIPADLLKTWKRSVVLIQARQFQMDQDRRELLAAMENAGLESICLKGITMAERYPKPEMRQMADNDILYRFQGDTERGRSCRSRDVLNAVMKGLDAKELSSDSIVETFQIGNWSLFEMHRDVWEPTREFYEYFRGIWDKAKILDIDHPLRKSMSSEDQFILMIAHSYKHKVLKGCGPREIADYYVFTSTELNLDWDYILKELRLLGIVSYFELLKRLSGCIFGDIVPTEDDWLELETFVRAGTYGTAEDQLKNELGRAKGSEGESELITKARYLAQRFKASDDYNSYKYPKLYKHSWLRWTIPFVRLFSSDKENRSRIRSEIENVFKATPRKSAGRI